MPHVSTTTLVDRTPPASAWAKPVHTSAYGTRSTFVGPDGVQASRSVRSHGAITGDTTSTFEWLGASPLSEAPLLQSVLSRNGEMPRRRSSLKQRIVKCRWPWPRKTKKAVTFGTTTTFLFARALAGCSVPSQPDGAVLGMARTHHALHIGPVDGHERKPLAPLCPATRFSILLTLDISNDELATEWATTDWVRDARTASATDFTVDACHDIVTQLRRRWGMRRYVLQAANRTPVTWTSRLRGVFRCSHDLY